MKLVLKIHQSLRSTGDPAVIEGELQEGIPLVEAIRKLTKDHPFIYSSLFNFEKLKNGVLYISGETELRSLGLLDEPITEDIVLKIVPVLHGG